MLWFLFWVVLEVRRHRKRERINFPCHTDELLTHKTFYINLTLLKLLAPNVKFTMKDV